MGQARRYYALQGGWVVQKRPILALRNYAMAPKGKFQVRRQKVHFSYRLLNRWNSLSEEVVSAGTFDTFKKRLEEWRRNFQ